MTGYIDANRPPGLLPADYNARHKLLEAPRSIQLGWARRRRVDKDARRDEAQPGEEVLAQLHLEEPTVAAAQDRYVLRSYSPIQTIAGGMILNTVPARHRRRRPQVLEQLATLRDGTAADALAVHLANAEYAGPPNDWATPTTNERHRICQTCTTPVNTRVASRNAQVICRYCDASMILRRSIRSAITPPKSEKTSIGPVLRKASNPSSSAEPVSE